MEKVRIIEQMFARYEHLAYTHNYIVGVTDKKTVFMAFTKSATVAKILSLDITSKGKTSIRYKHETAYTRKILMREAVKLVPLCSVETLEMLAKTMGKRANRGDAFEKLVAEFYGLKWVSSGNAKFTDCGDVVIDKIHYQVKYINSTFTDEATLTNLEALA